MKNDLLNDKKREKCKSLRTIYSMYIPIDCFDITDGASETDETKLPVESYLVNCRYCISSAIASICFNFSG